MRRSSLTVAVVLLFSAVVFAQHSGGGGSSGGSSGGGGGSHGGGGSSGASSGGHSGGSSSSSHASASSGSASHGKSGTTPPSTHQSNVRGSSIRVPHGEAAKAVRPEKRSFFSILRHPFRRQEKPVTDLRRRVCLNGPCVVCPAGQVSNGRGGCAGGFVANNHWEQCSRAGIWVGDGCLAHTSFLDQCEGLRMAMSQQASRMQRAESTRQAACASGATQECTEQTARSQSEASLFQTFQGKYQQCHQTTRTSNGGGRIRPNGP